MARRDTESARATVKTRVNTPMSRPLLYAHRGAAVERPENTLIAFARALELGADALETDAHLTLDGQVVLSHDPDGRRTAGVARAIKETTWADLRSWDVGQQFVDAHGERPFSGIHIPTLESLLAEYPGVPINVDLKEHSTRMVEATLGLLRRLRDEERVTLASFDTKTMRAVRRAGYRGRTCLAQKEVAEIATLPGAVWRRLSLRGSVAQIPSRLGPFRLGERWMIERCHAVGVPVEYWTIDEPAEARRLLSLGADGIMTNDPGAIAPVFREWNRPVLPSSGAE